MGAGVVVLREGFEASLVVGIVLAFLDRTGRRDGFAAVWIGVAAALALSLAVGIALFAAGAELEGRSEAIFEGVVMLFAAGLLTWMIFWMRNRARTLRTEIEGRTQAALDAGSAVGLGARRVPRRRARRRRDCALPVQLGRRLERSRVARRRDRRRASSPSGSGTCSTAARTG